MEAEPGEARNTQAAATSSSAVTRRRRRGQGVRLGPDRFFGDPAGRGLPGEHRLDPGPGDPGPGRPPLTRMVVRVRVRSRACGPAPDDTHLRRRVGGAASVEAGRLPGHRRDRDQGLPPRRSTMAGMNARKVEEHPVQVGGDRLPPVGQRDLVQRRGGARRSRRWPRRRGPGRAGRPGRPVSATEGLVAHKSAGDRDRGPARLCPPPPRVASRLAGGSRALAATAYQAGGQGHGGDGAPESPGLGAGGPRRPGPGGSAHPA